MRAACSRVAHRLGWLGSVLGPRSRQRRGPRTDPIHPAANVDPSVLSRFMNEAQAITIETMDKLGKVMLFRLVPTAVDMQGYWDAVIKDRRVKKKPTK